MKTNYFKTSRLTPCCLGIALVVGAVMAVTTYLDLARNTRAAEASMAINDRLYKDIHLCLALKTLHEGDVSAAAQRLDLLLCDDIIAVNSQLASADDADRVFIRKAFARLALARPKSAQVLTGTTQELCDDQRAAERILAETAAGGAYATEGIAASH
jgi:hypothetical protein